MAFVGPSCDKPKSGPEFHLHGNTKATIAPTLTYLKKIEQTPECFMRTQQIRCPRLAPFVQVLCLLHFGSSILIPTAVRDRRGLWLVQHPHILTWYIIPYLWINHWLGTLFFFATYAQNKFVISNYLLTMSPSYTHILAAHRSLDRSLRSQVVEFCSLRRCQHRPRVRIHQPLSVDGIVETHVLHHYVKYSILSRRRSHWGHQGGHGPPLPLGY